MWRIILLVTLLPLGWGCAMCAGPHDCKYAAYGGVHARSSMVGHRVGALYGPQPVFVVADAQASSVQAAPDSLTYDRSPSTDGQDDAEDEEDESESDTLDTTPADDDLRGSDSQELLPDDEESPEIDGDPSPSDRFERESETDSAYNLLDN